MYNLNFDANYARVQFANIYQNMNDNYQLYSEKQISIATFIGGPIAAGILLRKNYLNLERPKAAFNALFLGIFATIIIYIGLFILPDNIVDKMPNVLIPLIYTGIISIIVNKSMGIQILNHRKNGMIFFSYWNSFGVAIIALVINVAFIFSIVYFSPADFDSKTYNSEIDTFTKNENNALLVFDKLQSPNQKELIPEFTSSLELWKKNKEISLNIRSIDNLPAELLEKSIFLESYTDLRIKQFSLIIKALEDDQVDYSEQLINVANQIELLVGE